MKFDVACDSMLKNRVLPTVLEIFWREGAQENADFFGKFLSQKSFYRNVLFEANIISP